MTGWGSSTAPLVAREPDGACAATQLSDRELLDRFVASRDEDAFAALVHRHGPMVLGVCRRVLRDREDAQDAFQVTFLVLARKASSLSQSELLANWLYGVAYRTAAHMRGRSARRSDRGERQVVDMPAPPPQDDEENREVLAVLDEELNHLPEMYRTLLVLCYLEGRTHQEAAREVDCPAGSVSWRIARARRMLHKRLTRRGLVLPLAVFALLLARQRAIAVPEELVQVTTTVAVGPSAAVPPEQAALTEEVLRLPDATGGGVYRPWLLALLLFALLAGMASAAVVATRDGSEAPSSHEHAGSDVTQPPAIPAGDNAPAACGESCAGGR